MTTRPEPPSLLRYEPPARVTDKNGLPPRKDPGVLLSSGRASVDEVLQAILPPRTWSRDGETWAQRVSSTPATIADLVKLQERLDAALRQRQARDAGICPIREELYASFLDELIRQVTIHCAERGLVLVSVRDELNSTIAAYQQLYESAIAFGIRKTLLAERTRAELQATTEVLTADVAELERTVQALEARVAEATAAESGPGSRAALEEEEHQREVMALRASIDGMKEELEAALAPPPLNLAGLPVAPAQAQA